MQRSIYKENARLNASKAGRIVQGANRNRVKIPAVHIVTLSTNSITKGWHRESRVNDGLTDGLFSAVG